MPTARAMQYQLTWLSYGHHLYGPPCSCRQTRRFSLSRMFYPNVDMQAFNHQRLSGTIYKDHCVAPCEHWMPPASSGQEFNWHKYRLRGGSGTSPPSRDSNSLAVTAEQHDSTYLPYIGDSYCKQCRNIFQFQFPPPPTTLGTRSILQL